MAKVRQRGTAPELALARLLRANGMSYRLNVRTLPGSPDFANKRRRWAVFVHGCFWHAHRACSRSTIPKSNRDFWIAKFKTNRERDARNVRSLRKLGFRVAVFWECEVNRADSCCRRLSKLIETRGV